jgi:hypothetical protein
VEIEDVSLSANDDKYRDFIYGDDHRSHLMDRSNSPGGYKFGRTEGKRVRARNALGRINGCFKSMIETIADAKLRRMERELELRGIRFDRSGDSWVVRKSQPTGRS